MAKGFCLCERYSVTKHPWNATWCYICDRPIAQTQENSTGQPADDGEAESVRIAEVFDQARTDLDRDKL